MSGDRAAPQRRRKITVALPTNRFEDASLLFKVSTSVSYRVPSSADESNSGEKESESPRPEDSSSQTARRERRKYKGADYEKGEDGQWHLLHK
jgi:hypothetical protein